MFGHFRGHYSKILIFSPIIGCGSGAACSFNEVMISQLPTNEMPLAHLYLRKSTQICWNFYQHKIVPGFSGIEQNNITHCRVARKSNSLQFRNIELLIKQLRKLSFDMIAILEVPCKLIINQKRSKHFSHDGKIDHPV